MAGAARPLGVLSVILACGWALPGALGGWLGFVSFYADTGPGFTDFSLIALSTNMAMMFTPAVLAGLGMACLGAAGRAGSRWVTGWTAIMAACLTVNVLTMLWSNQMWPVLWVPSRLDLLIISAGHLLAGIAMTATLVAAIRKKTPAHDAGRPPSLTIGPLIALMGAAAYALTGDSLYVLAMSWWLGLLHSGAAITIRRRYPQASHNCQYLIRTDDRPARGTDMALDGTPRAVGQATHDLLICLSRAARWAGERGPGKVRV